MPVNHRKITLVSLLVLIAAVIGMGYWLLPSGFDTDLDRVGQGRPAVVLVHDHNYVESVELMEAVDRERGAWEEDVDFLVADVHREEGRDFTDRHGVSAVTLLAFDGEGERIGIHTGRADVGAVRNWLDEKFGPQ